MSNYTICFYSEKENMSKQVFVDSDESSIQSIISALKRIEKVAEEIGDEVIIQKIIASPPQVTFDWQAQMREALGKYWRKRGEND